MFIKTTKSKNHTYLQLVESYRKNGTVKHKVLFNLGRLDQLQQNGQLHKIACKLLTLSKQPPPAQLQKSKPTSKTVPTSLNIEETGRYIYGHIVFKKFWKQLDMERILNKVQQQTKIKYDLSKMLYVLIVNRLLSPSSKLAAFKNQHQFVGLEKMSHLHHVYNCLDILANHKQQIESALFRRQHHLFNQQLDVIFFDVTTFHFESVRADELKNFGFSKAGKFNEVQVVLGLLVDQEGRPIGYELFKGNTSEKKTLLAMLQKLSERFSLQQIVIVADKGLNSKQNLQAIRQAGYHYIVSSSLKSAKKEVKQSVFDQEGYTLCYQSTDDIASQQATQKQKATPSIQAEVLNFKHKIIPNEFSCKDENGEEHTYTDQLLISWSKNRASKNAKDRQRQVEKAKQYLANNTSVLNNKKGAKRYLATTGQQKAKSIDYQKIEADKKWDGYYAIQYSNKQFSAQDILKQYHFLWKIEESFRVLKTTMKTRPIFHWTPNRIKGHFTLCFIAFLVERLLEIKLKEKGLILSPQKIKEALCSLQVSALNIEEQAIYLKGACEQEAKDILKVLGIKPIKNMQVAADARF